MNLAETSILPAPVCIDWRMPVGARTASLSYGTDPHTGRYAQPRPSPCADAIEAVLKSAGRPLVPAQVQQDLSARVRSSAGTIMRQMFERGILKRRAVGNTHEYWI